MASPHAAGVAALAVAEYGKRDRKHGGLTLAPGGSSRSCAGLRGHAVPGAARVPLPGGRDGDVHATCEGSRDLNGFYGDGIVSASRVVGADR